MLESPPMADRLIEDLSPIQQEAVRWGEGALLVLAGPGSGKTRVLTRRIARLLEQSADQKFRILGLTFTNKAADEMRSRVEELVPGHSTRLFLGTFHSFCAEVLRQHGSHLGLEPDFHIYSSGEDQGAVLSEALQGLREQGLGVHAADVSLLPAIERLRAELVEPEDAPRHVSSPALAERIESIYRAYDACLRKANALDFGSLIFYAVKLFRQFPALSKRYRKVYPYWCIDEFQDTNTSQYALLRAMAGDEFKNVFAVADDDQIIYEWNGASHRRLEEFRQDFQPEVLQLPTNYRCPPQIVSLANNLISYNSQRTQGKRPLESGKAAGLRNGSTVRLGQYNSDRDEARAVAADIKRLHWGAPQGVAVLARSRKILEHAQRALSEEGLHSVLAQRRDSFLSAPFRWLNACLQQSNHRRDKRNLELLCATFQEMTGVSLDPEDIIAAADATHQDYLRQWADMVASIQPSGPAHQAALQVTEHLVRGTSYSSFVDFAVPWFETLTPEFPSKPEDYLEDKSAWVQLQKELVQSLGARAPLEAFLQELDMRSKEPPPKPGSITLMTIHAAKGREFDHVYLMGLAEDQLPSFHAVKRGERSIQMEEERRSCFVAITRARETLTLTFAQAYYGWPKRPSRFLYEMGFSPS